MVVFREANEYSGTPKCAYYGATMNACEGSGHTSAFQCGAHQEPPLGTFVTAGREVLQPYSVYQTRAGTALFPCAGTAMPQSSPWDATLNPWCTSDSADGTGGAGSWAFQGELFLAMTGSTRMASSPCFPGLALNKLKAGILVWRVFILFLFVFNWGSIIIYGKHSEASSRAILQLQLGLSSLYALVHLYRVNWRLKQIKYSICVLLFLFLFFSFKNYLCIVSFTVCWNWPSSGNNYKVKMKRKSCRKQNACKIC